MFRVAKLNEAAVVPVRAHDGDAGMDLTSVESVLIPAKGQAIVGTGLAFAFPSDCYARIAPRSGLAVKHGLSVGAGVADSHYRGEYKVVLFNHSDKDYQVNVGDRIAQVIFEKIFAPTLEEVIFDALGNTERGDKGFGSSGQ
jgi:dUTP pyrophosphatase